MKARPLALPALAAALTSLISLPARADDSERSFGLGTAGGYGFEAVAVTSGTPTTATGGAPFYPSLELQFFNDKGGSFDLSVPIGNIVKEATGGAVEVAAAAYYSPKYNDGVVRGVLAPGLGLSFVSMSPASAFGVQLRLRVGVELLGADQHFGIMLLAEPELGLGVASANTAAEGAFAFSITALIAVTLYGTGAVHRPGVREPTTRSGPGDAPVAAPTRDVDALILAIQRNPKPPEVGATRVEAKALCERQRGVWIDRGNKVGCKVRGENLFVCEVAEDATMSGCTHWKLGADLPDERNAIVASRGKPTSAETNAQGFRSYTWEGTGDTLILSGYAAGVVVTETKTTEQTLTPDATPPKIDRVLPAPDTSTPNVGF